jgi:hypothetical protein
VKKVSGSDGGASSRLVWSPDETDLDPVAVRLPNRVRARLARVFRLLAATKRAPMQRGERPPVQVLLQGMTQDARARSLISWLKMLEKAVERQRIVDMQQPGRVANS